MGETILFVVFVCLSAAGGTLIFKRTGNYDVDYFTKIIGWALFIVGAYGIFELVGRYII